jgi:hypothetical protein
MYMLNDRIEINPEVCHGKPVVRGTRVLVSQILGTLSGGDSIEDVLADYPSRPRTSRRYSPSRHRKCVFMLRDFSYREN